MSKIQVAEMLIDIQALGLGIKDPFIFASGLMSPIYVDCRSLISHPEKRKDIINMLVSKIEEEIGIKNIDLVAGVASVGIPIASWLAERLDLPMIFIRSSVKDHGKQNQIEGILNKGDRVIVIEDLISTGISTVDSVKAVRDAGGIVKHCVAVFDYNLKSSNLLFKREYLKKIFLTDLITILDLAVYRGIISESQKGLSKNGLAAPKSGMRKEKKKFYAPRTASKIVLLRYC